jgi:hypothetical protein
VVTAGVLVLIQFVPVSRSNPPVRGEIEGPPEAMAVLQRACYDCHSNRTAWPWYSRVAPVSWLVSHDVAEGREHLNFTEWDALRPSARRHVIEELWEEVEEGEMPLPAYRAMHPEARLSAADKETLRAWAAEE